MTTPPRPDQQQDPPAQVISPGGMSGVFRGREIIINGIVAPPGSGIFVYNNAGKQISIIGVSETPSNLAWGDSDFATLYVSARSAVYRIRLDVKGSVQY